MRRTLPLLLAGALLAAAAARPAAAEDVEALWRRNRRLAAEAALAATPKPYFLMDLESRRISLMTRGMTLLELRIEEALLWGRRPAIGPSAIAARDALARPEIKPGEDKPQSIDDQLLELVDMPTRYHLRLAGDVEVEVVPLAEGRWPLWRQRLELWRWRLSRPLVTLRQRRERHEATTVLLVLRPEEARRMYWSFFEGLDGILIPPR